MAPVIDIRDVTIGFPAGGVHERVVDNVSLTVGTSECVALIGESGSGKSLLALQAAGVTPKPGRLLGGEVRCAGRPGLVMQEASSAFNPVLTIGFQIREVAPGGRIDEALLRDLGFEDIPALLTSYAHQLSGGQAQRAFIAMALAGNPEAVIADEPTTGLDSATQRDVLRVFTDLIRERGIGLLLISHDLAAVADVADRIAVIHGGRIVETGPARAVLDHPIHPFSRWLADPYSSTRRMQPPPVSRMDDGCRFAHRCDIAESRCHQARPRLAACGSDREVRCPVALESERTS